jgi:Xaa-Pro dipeptidase
MADIDPVSFGRSFSDPINPLIEHCFAAERLVNIERAYEIMDQHNLTGLVATIPHNIYYLSSHSGIMQWMGRHFSTYAYLPRDPNAPPALIANGTMLYHFDYRPTWMENIKAISSPEMDADGKAVIGPDGFPKAKARPGVWSIREGVDYSRGDRIQMALFDRYTDRTVTDALSGLREALVEGGSAKGRVGFDDPRPGYWLKEKGLPDLVPVDACNIFKDIRRAKTPVEVELLRKAAVAGETALMDAIGKIGPGSTLAQVEYDFSKKWADLGGTAKWLICNVNGVNSGTIETGQWMKLDSVGTLQGYHGDVGRTVMVGEPEDELARRIEACCKVAPIVYDAIRPGMLYMEAAQMFHDLMQQEGVNAVGGPHDVGLEHTDHPVDTGSDAVPATLSFMDLRFLEGTVFTLDMPWNEMGWGTCHVEDMLVVRKNGCELLSSGDISLKVIK